MNLNNYGEFLEGLNRLLRERDGAIVQVVIHTPGGLEIIHNCPDTMMRMGPLQGALILTEDEFKTGMEAAKKSGETKMVLENMADTIEGKKKQLN